MESMQVKTCEACGGEMKGYKNPFEQDMVFWQCPTCVERGREIERERFMRGPALDVVKWFGPLHGELRVELDDRLRAFADGSNRAGGGLFIQGVCGSGKSQILSEIAHVINEVGAVAQLESESPPERFGSCFSVYFGISVRARGSWELDMRDTRVLILDDVDLFGDEQFGDELLRVVDYRHRYGLPMIFASSSPMAATFGREAIRSRVGAMCGEPFVLPAVNRRLVAAP